MQAPGRRPMSGDYHPGTSPASTIFSSRRTISPGSIPGFKARRRVLNPRRGVVEPRFHGAEPP